MMARGFAIAVGVVATAACGRIGYDPVGGTDAIGVDADPTCRFRSISLGREHGCAVDAAGAVHCWGADPWGMTRGAAGDAPAPTPVRVPLPAPVVEVAAGSNTTCARTDAGAAWCWGAAEGGASGSLGGVTPLDVGGPVRGLAGGLGHMCAVVGPDDHVACWGDNHKGQLGQPPSDPIATPQVVADTAGTIALTVGHRDACARLAGGRVRCWGHDDAGQLGLGVTEFSTAPTDVPALTGYAAIALGGRHACGVDGGGGLRCWGRNDRGELGDSTGGRTSPGPAIRADVVAVATAARATCALDRGGTVACFGQNRAGELGLGDLAPRATPTAVAGLTGVRALVAGAHHLCAEVAGTIVCWGDNDAGQLGRGTRSIATTPVRVAAALGPVSDVAVTLHSACAVAGGAVWCWGDGELGQLGGGAITGAIEPVQALPSGVLALAAAGGQICARDAGGVWCWGIGYPGDGRGYGVVSAPARAIASPMVTDVAVGFDFACAVVAGAARCWGAGDLGQLGDGGTGEAFTPVAVTMPTGVAEVAAGASHACGRTTAGALWCWGENSRGQVGVDSGGVAVATPVAVTLPATTARAVAAARVHTCALGDDQAVYCWGENESGQLGGAGPDQVTPQRVPLPGPALAVFARYDTSCATLADGQTLCWGANAYGSRGTGDEGSGPTPAPFGAVTGATVVAGAFAVQCAIDAAGELRCAGAGSRGALGPDPLGATPSPVAISCQ